MQKGHFIKTIIMRIQFTEQYSRFHWRVSSRIVFFFSLFITSIEQFILNALTNSMKIQTKNYIKNNNFSIFEFRFVGQLIFALCQIWKRLYIEWLLLLADCWYQGVTVFVCKRMVLVRTVCMYSCDYTLRISFQRCVNNSVVHFAVLYFRAVF